MTESATCTCPDLDASSPWDLHATVKGLDPGCHVHGVPGGPLNSHDRDLLATYNAERYRGILHTEEWRVRMAGLHKRWADNLRAEIIRKSRQPGGIMILDAGTRVVAEPEPRTGRLRRLLRLAYQGLIDFWDHLVAGVRAVVELWWVWVAVAFCILYGWWIFQ
jgi:hypothetical protein